MFEDTGPTVADVLAPVVDPETRQQLRTQDDEEDFLDEGKFNNLFYALIFFKLYVYIFN